ncbi:RNB domain family protein [Babesia bovis T2Bo]|uniref:RNB-like protein n=1 Tax=Babesia bovis TaxID=5865 RepID=A7AQY3_BABBO|nr:RNB domain family protein [Babesia bovis T2Bo]EDO06952.1 RNB domain family protein [Babesia bovis T2Bo]|eukprot:XP_001610520.1 RNB-like protein [Babesia bovis T2Bo]
MLLGSGTARAFFNVYANYLLYARRRCIYRDNGLRDVLLIRYVPFASSYVHNRRNEEHLGLAVHSEDGSDIRQVLSRPTQDQKLVKSVKDTDIAYEPYWDDARIHDLETERPDLVVRGTVVIPAFATTEAKVVINPTYNRTDSAEDADSSDSASTVASIGEYDTISRESPCSDLGLSPQSSGRVTKKHPCTNRKRKLTDVNHDSDPNVASSNPEVRIFGFLSRNRAFHGDEVVALRQRRLRNTTTDSYRSLGIANECRVIAVTKRSPSLDNFVVVIDEDAISKSSGGCFKCQPQDTRWPAFNVNLECLSPEIQAHLSRLPKNAKYFGLMRFISWDENDIEPSGVITRVIGDVTEPYSRMYSLMVFRGLNPNGFSDEVLRNLDDLIQQAELTKYDNRHDRRDLTVITIDPQDAKDLDDALSVETRCLDGKYVYTVGVHIADVSHYVTEGSLVDLDARERATSVYLEHQVFPMLPQMLSEKLCSLLPGSEKLCFSMFADLSEDPTGGELVGNNLYISNQTFQLTRIVSDSRLSYQTAKEIIYRRLEDCDLGISSDLSTMDIPTFHQRLIDLELPNSSSTSKNSIWPPLVILYYLSRKLRDYRLRHRGAVTVDTTGSYKCHIPNIESGADILRIEHVPKESHELVEEMMLLANTQAAQLLSKSFDRYFLRVHENTSKAIKQLISSMMPPELKQLINPDVLQIPEVLRKCAHHMEPTAFQSLSFAALQQFKEAVYSPINKDVTSSMSVTGHWGLALPMYLHFTSPIRRYSDLYTHRMLKSVISNTHCEQSLKVLDDICKQCNLQKRRAFDAQKEYKNFAFNQYLKWACADENRPKLLEGNREFLAKAFNGKGADLWGMLYHDACVFSIVCNYGQDEVHHNKTSIVFYIPLLNEQRSLSCETLCLEPVQVVIDGEKVDIEDSTKQSCIVDNYHKEIQHNAEREKHGSGMVQSLKVRRDGNIITLSHFQKVTVVLIPGSVMWSLRLANDA